MNFKKLFSKKRILCGLASLAAGAFFHVVNPVWPQQLKYLATDKFTETSIERRIEKEFGISYYGNKDDATLNTLETNLNLIKKENPNLISHLKCVVLYSQNDLDFFATKPFLYFDGRAFSLNSTIELCSNSNSTLIHELSHILNYHSPKSLNQEMEKIHGDSIGKDLEKTFSWYKITLPVRWKDGSVKPQNGQVRPYGAFSAGDIDTSLKGLATLVHEFGHYKLQALSDNPLQRPLKFVQFYDVVKNFSDSGMINSFKDGIFTNDFGAGHPSENPGELYASAFMIAEMGFIPEYKRKFFPALTEEQKTLAEQIFEFVQRQKY